jgi:transcriptional regulator of acetoin/glycerol metabolism
MHANHFLTCSAAPILDPRGNILGVLDVSGDQRSYHQHTMALVKMSARMIENHWLSDDFRNMMRLHFHSRVEFIGTLMEGILAVSPDGKIVGANRSALEQLRVSGAALRMHSLDSLFGTAVGTLADRFRSPLALPLPLALADGRTVHLRAQFNWPAWAPGGDTGASALARASRDAEDATMRLMGAHCEQAVSASTGSVADADRASDPPVEGAVAADTGLRHLQTGDAQIDALTTKLRRVLNRDIPVLILGETGTGKELLARAFHHDSDRARKPFVAVNCASIPETLIEAELFGYEEGAFTGARRKGATGKIVQASGGTLFLDEIGDMPLALQAHLLRVLQERQVTPLGSSKSVSVDVAIVCATHRNLREMIEAKQFREDLYYRLNGLAVRLPALRDRTDLQVLIHRILERQIPQRTPSLAPEVLKMFTACTWPGNVRQLFNVLRTAAVMCAGDPVITREHLSDDFVDEALRHAGAAAAVLSEPVRGPATAGPAGPPARAATAPSRPLQDLEIEAIRRSVDQAGGNISEAAKQLGISRNTIYRKLRWRSG